MQYNFTDRVRKVLAAARDESVRLRHDYVGTEHILLGLLSEGEGVAMATLRQAGVDPQRVREMIDESVRPGRAAVRGELPYTSRAKKTLEYAMETAREFNHSYVGTEHLLIGLLREEKGIAGQVLNALGISLELAVKTTSQLLGMDGTVEVSAGPGTPTIMYPPRSAFRVNVDDTSDRSIYEQIIAQVQEGVATGALQPGDRLQPVRQLADKLDIAPGTVARAYSELERRGVVITEGARGTRIAPRAEGTPASAERLDALAGLLRPVAVAAFHMGASADALRGALDKAMSGIFDASSS